MSQRRTHTPAKDARLPLRIPRELLAKLDAHWPDHEDGSRSDFIRRAIDHQMIRDRITGRDREARAAFKDGVFEQ